MNNFQWGFAVSAVAFAVTSPKPALATPEWSCLQPALQSEMEGQLVFQDQFHAIVIAERSDLAEVSARSTEVAKLNINLTGMLQEWIWANDPTRLNTLEAYRTFSWTDEDRVAFVSNDTDAQALQSELDDLNQKLGSDPNVGNYYGFLGETETQSQLSEIIVSVVRVFGSKGSLN